MTRRDKPPPPSSSRRRSERRACRRRHVADGGADSSVQLPRPSAPKTIYSYLEGLYERRGSDREEALASIIGVLNSRLEHDFLENNFASFLYRGLNSFKKGSSKEKQLSLHLVGLLAMIVGYEDKVSEVYRELLPVLSKAPKSGTTAVKVLDCLGIVAFFGATNSEDIQNAMQIIWKFIHADQSDANEEKHSAAVLVAAINAWLFLLTSVEGWRLRHNNWNGAIDYFSTLLLKHDDKLVRVAASEALALIFETGSLEKFWGEGKERSYSHMQQLLRESIVANDIREVVKYFGNFQCPGTSLTVNGKDLKLSSWYQKIQLQFLKGFLAEGFELQVKENEKLQNLFEFNPHRIINSGRELYVSTTDKISVSFFLPEERDPEKLTKEDRKKQKIWRNSVLKKAQTQLMTKHRRLSEEMNRSDYD
ncbi:hypothetical protein PRUPE_3G276000 [Prunus persica]|uniref:Interferon-related developmental regulator N-terminal domain-containing protein n=1 Tax=Prunus persica TaxID=3760 RepID=M5XIY2_PRUPE|nr:uncharacterized protein LOC18783968 [Prunus persica]ONI19381.1 hypothetical protein PRUPE_3G276000 [Prunus persica]